MTLQKILNEYNIEIPKDKYILEYFVENEKFNVFNMDFLPKITPRKNIWKFSQIEVFYQETLSKPKLREEYIRLEWKYINVLIKLWVYSDVFVISDSIYANSKMLKKCIERKYKKYIRSILKDVDTQSMVEATEKEIMEFYSMLGVRNLANVVYYFKDLHALIFTNWSCFSIVFLKEEHFDFVKKVVESEGLFLRENETTLYS